MPTLVVGMPWGVCSHHIARRVPLAACQPVLGATSTIAPRGHFLFVSGFRGQAVAPGHRFYRTLPGTGWQAASGTRRGHGTRL